MNLSFNSGLFGRNGSVPNTSVHIAAIEGRNGCLSRLHHTGRGFSPQTLQVLTIIHNFDTRRADGTTPAQRLFHQTFPYLFEWVVDDLGDLPLPRKSSKSHYSQTLSGGLFPP